MRHRLALNTDLAVVLVDGAAPEWVEMIPAGPAVTGRDGRTWLFDAVAGQNVLDSFGARAVDLPIDWNHALQHSAPQGGDSPAAAWIDRLEMRDGALWCHVTWTDRGASDVAGRAYRYLSPVFDYDPASNRIVRLVSAGLTNTPNLRLPALNSEEEAMPRSAALVAAITGALGLNAESSDDAVATAITQLKTTAVATAANAEQPSLERFVPRADYDAVVSRAANAEQALSTHRQAQHDQAVNAEIDTALKSGKITPATADYHRASCADQAGLERFRAFVTAAPVIAPDVTSLDKKPGAQGSALNAEERFVADSLGIPHDQFKKDGV